MSYLTRFVFAALSVMLGTAAAAKSPTKQLLPLAQSIVNHHPLSAPPANCHLEQFSGYDNLPTQRCRYKKGKLTGEVTVIAPTAEQMIKQVLFTCESFNFKLTDTFQVSCGRVLLSQIQRASGGEFAVAGVVIEGGRAFAYRNGVHVAVAGFPDGTVKQPTAAQIDAAFHGTVSSWDETSRLQGATFDQYAHYGRLTDLNGKLIDDSALTFPDLVGMRLRSDWPNSDSLLRAWTCGNINTIKSQMSCVRLPDDTPGAARRHP